MYRIKRKLKQNGTKNDLRKRLEYVTSILNNDGTSLWKALTNHVSMLWFGTNHFLSEYWVESSLSHSCVYSKKSSHPVSLSVWKENISPKFSNFVSWLRLSLTNTNLPMLFTIRQQFSWQLRWMQLTFTPLSHDTFVHAGAHLRKPHAGAHLRKP